MKTLQKIGTGLFCLVFLVMSYQETKAAHSLGGEITYKNIGPNQYELTLILYRDDYGFPFPATQTINWSGSGFFSNGSGSVVADSVPNSGINITNLCGQNYPFWVIEADKQTYSAIVTIPPSFTDVTFFTSFFSRNSFISSIGGGVNTTARLHIESTLHKSYLGGNNSAKFLGSPIFNVCANDTFQHSFRASDIDGDQLVYSLVPCKGSLATNVPYLASFSGIAPLGAGTPVSLDSVTGMLSFYPTNFGVYIFCVQIREYRNGILKGTVSRDIQLRVLPCTNQGPTLTGMNGGNTYVLNTCPNTPICFDIIGQDLDNDSIQIEWDEGIAGASFLSKTGYVLGPDTTQFCWTPTNTSIGQHFFSVKIKDDACPTQRNKTYLYTINVTNPTNPINAGADTQICKGDTTTLVATTTATNIQNVTWTPNIGLSNPNSLTTQANPNSSMYYTVTLEYTDGCISQDQVYVEVVDGPLMTVYPQSANVCGGTTFTLSATTDVAGMNFNWYDPSMVALGAGTINSNTSTLNITTPAIAGSYTYTIVCQNPTTLCSVTELITLHVLSPTSQTRHIYASNTGTVSAAGTALAPTTLEEAIKRAACDNTIIKMDTGVYILDSTLYIPSYITLEGGFMQGNAWKKTSEAGATIIRRSALNPEGLLGAQRLVALAVLSSQNFRLQDLTIETADASNPGMSTYGLHMQNASEYTLARVQIFPGNAANGTNGVDGSGRSGAAGTHPMDGIPGQNGINGAADPSQGGGGYGGNGGFVTAIVPGGQGGTTGGTQGATGQDGGDMPPATWNQCTLNGGSGGGGGSGGCSNCVVGGNIANTGYDGGSGGRGGSSGTACNNNPFWGNPYFGTCGSGFSGSSFGFGTVTAPGIGGASGANGLDGSTGETGEPGCDGALGTLGSHIIGFPFWTVGAEGQRGEHGTAGSGGGGGGGSGNNGGFAGNGGGGGGGGGAAGEAGSGGSGGGASFGAYIVDNGINGTIIDCKIIAGTPGLGGVGGIGGTGGLGGAGGTASSANGIMSGNGGNGGDGGNGGNGGHGQAGVQQNIYIGGTSLPLVMADSSHDFASEAIIWVTDVNTIGETVEFVDPNLPTATASTNWDFDVYSNNAIPATGINNSDTTEYSIEGRYTIAHATHNYEGFHHIIFNSNPKPNINTTASSITSDTVQLCVGDFAAFYSDKMGDTIVWDFDGAIPNPGNVQNTSFVQFNTSGIYTITLRLATNCCGSSPIDTVYLYVDDKPAAVGSGDIYYCKGGSGILSLTGLSPMDTVIWSPTNDLTFIGQDSVLVNPDSTITYIANIYRKTTIVGQNTLSCPLSIPFNVVVQNPAQISLTATNLTCNNDGTATVAVINGVGPYTYNWSNGNSTTAPTISNTITGLASGVYTVTVLDLGTINSCDEVAQVFVYPGAAAPNLGVFNRIDPSCVGTNDGEAMAMVVNGTAPYDYVWTGPITIASGTNVVSQTATGLIPGTYSVTATDALGCEDATSFVIVDPAPLSIYVHAVTNPSCLNNSNGEIIIEGFGGTGIYAYTWNDGMTAQSNTIGTLSSIDSGDYQITVADANSCEAYTTITLTTQNQDSAGINLNSNLAGANPQLFIGDSYFIDGYSSDSANLSYSWSPSGSLSCNNCLNPVASPTQTTTYYFTATPSGTSCVFEDSITIEAYPNTPIDTLYFGVQPDSTLSECLVLPSFILGTQGSFAHIGNSLSGSLTYPSFACFDFAAGSVAGALDTLVLVACEQLCDTTVVVIATNTCVWPGDTNDDQIANNVDLLPIGLHMGATGLLRPNANLTYTCQPSPDWGIGTLGQPTTDIKHVDADGNAIINKDDTLAIVQNWGQIHLRGSGGSSTTGVPLSVDTLVANPGDTLHLPILLGDVTSVVTDAYGLAYSIGYDQTNIKANSVYVTYDNSWMGTNLNTLNLQKDFYAQGEVETALTRITQTPISGFGQIGTLHLIIKDVVSFGGMGAMRLDFEVKDAYLIDHFGNLIPVDNKLTQVLVIDPATSATMLEDKESVVKIVPNPASYHLDISTTDQYIEKVVLYASDGRQIRTQIETGQVNQLQISLKELPAGLYHVAIQTDRKVYNQQFIIKR